MRLLQNAKISVKIISLLMMLGAITLFIAWNGSRRMLSADAQYSELIDKTLPNATKLARVNRRAVEMVYAGYRTIFYDGSSAQARAADEQARESYAAATKLLGEVRKSEPALAAELDVLGANLDKLDAIVKRTVALGLMNRNDEARGIVPAADVLLVTLADQTTALVDSQNAAGSKLSAELTASAESTATTLLLTGVLAVLGGIGLALVVTRTAITGPLSRLQGQMGDIAAGDYAKAVEGVDRGDEVGAMAKAVLVFRDNGIAKQAADVAKARADTEQQMVVSTVAQHLSELSDGDLTAEIKADFPSDYAALKANYNEALGKLRELIASVGESAATIRTGSGEIAQASEDLARRTESNAASLEETAASVTQMDGRLKASAGAATRTVERADQAIATVGGGRAVADEAVQAMGRVSESAKGIDSVIEGLDKIAFQTRVLAMNAAVEAGRAGDAGRGFAVVADLVSALAMRAEEEAKRARDQLTVTQTDIVTAVEAVQKVDGALADISGDVGQVHELLATMAADNLAQSAAITQISAAIGTMDQSTQQNAAMVEETSAAARNLASEVGSLSEKSSRFNVGATSAYTPPARPAKPVAGRSKSVDARAYASPVKALPVAAVAALTRNEDDWKDF
jgi:methyl-accepting chemotaxis protein